jgi:hypothetical protein
MDKYKQIQSYWQRNSIFLRNFASILAFVRKIQLKTYDRTTVGKERRRGDTSIVRTGHRACTGAVAEDEERV